ncbi:MAG: hypothetical protein MI757_06970 [Pirellulales bacterium]|nr:hypothetical protein [Pirellulales bacterium]
MPRRRTTNRALLLLSIALVWTSNVHAGWPLGQPAKSPHVGKNYFGYYVTPTYKYMPRAYPYGNFGARGYAPHTVHYDHHHYLRTWGPWPGH